MNKLATKEDCRVRIAKAVGYINTHLNEDMRLADIAAVAHFSPFHFHRIFKALRGEPLGCYIARLRVETAAQLLLCSNMSVEEIAYNVGFEVPASLSKAFRQFYDKTPSEYRTTKTPYAMKTLRINPPVKLKAPKIEELEPKTAICISLVGAYDELDFPDAFARLWGEIKTRKLFTAGIENICVYHDDPSVVESSKLRTDVCLTIHKPATANGEVGVTTIEGGRYAVFTHVGPYSELEAVYDAIFGEWVPANCTCGDECRCGDDCKCALREGPVFEKYRNDPTKTAPEKLRTEIYIPIK